MVAIGHSYRRYINRFAWQWLVKRQWRLKHPMYYWLLIEQCEGRRGLLQVNVFKSANNDRHYNMTPGHFCSTKLKFRPRQKGKGKCSCIRYAYWPLTQQDPTVQGDYLILNKNREVQSCIYQNQQQTDKTAGAVNALARTTGSKAMLTAAEGTEYLCFKRMNDYEYVPEKEQ